MALQLGATFVARSFSGDKDQLVPLIKAAHRAQGRGLHRRASAPASQFNNHAGSTKSFDYVREHNEAVNRLDVITGRDADHRRLRAGHGRDGRRSTTARCCALRKLAADYDPHDRIAAMNYPAAARTPRARSSPACSTSTPRPSDLHEHLDTVDTPLNALGREGAVPGLGGARQDQRQPALTAASLSAVIASEGEAIPASNAEFMAEIAASPCGLLAMTLGRIPPLKKPSLETPAWDITGEYKVKCKAKPGIREPKPADLVLNAWPLRCHSGAPRSGEPGIHEPGAHHYGEHRVGDSRLATSSRPGMTMERPLLASLSQIPSSFAAFPPRIMARLSGERSSSSTICRGRS